MECSCLTQLMTTAFCFCTLWPVSVELFNEKNGGRTANSRLCFEGYYVELADARYKTDLRRIFCVFLLAHIASQEREDQYQEAQETSKENEAD